jgi:hypothetical protein
MFFAFLNYPKFYKHFCCFFFLFLSFFFFALSILFLQISFLCCYILLDVFSKMSKYTSSSYLKNVLMFIFCDNNCRNFCFIFLILRYYIFLNTYVCMYICNGCFFKFGVEVGVELSIVNALYRLRITDQLFKSYTFTRVVRSQSTLQRLLRRQIKKKNTFIHINFSEFRI